MAGSVNKVILIGNLGRPRNPHPGLGRPGRQPAHRHVRNLARRNSGERKEKTEWHRVVIFNENIVKVAENYLKKGSTVYIEGAIQTRKWADQSGVEKYSTEIVLQKFRGELTMLGGRGDNAGASSGGGYDEGYAGGAGAGGGGNFGGGAPRSQPSGPRESFSADLDDEIPF
jgi:single-strand DNA-binding protein